MLKRRLRSLIALVDGSPVGAAYSRGVFLLPEPAYGFVNERTPNGDIAVLPAYRGKGIWFERFWSDCFREIPSMSLSCDPSKSRHWRTLCPRFGFKSRSQTADLIFDGLCRRSVEPFADGPRLATLSRPSIQFAFPATPSRPK